MTIIFKWNEKKSTSIYIKENGIKEEKIEEKNWKSKSHLFHFASYTKWTKCISCDHEYLIDEW